MPVLSQVSFDATVAVQAHMLGWARDLLGVDTTTAPDSLFNGLIRWDVTQAATRRVPNWPALTAVQRLDFDIGVTKLLAARAIQPLKTLMADGERAGDVQAGKYDWEHRRQQLEAEANAALMRCATQYGGVAAPAFVQFAPYGPSKQDAFRSPDLFRAPATARPFPWIPEVP